VARLGGTARGARATGLTPGGTALTVVKAVITTLDNRPLLQQQVAVLADDGAVDEIVVVDNGSEDGTHEWLRRQRGLTLVTRENRGAGPGRNAGIDAAGDFDYVLLLDGGIRPLRRSVERLHEYLERRRDADVVAIDFLSFETQPWRAHRSWPGEIGDDQTYRNGRLSLTAYCLARARAFDGLRFCEAGPFAEPGWGVDDDEMAYRWSEAGIVVHAVVGVRPYRRASGSFERLFRETGIWPNQYGSVYEKRLVWCQQNWPQYGPGVQWGEPWLTVVVVAQALEPTIRLIKYAHDRLRERHFVGRWSDLFAPYSVVVWHRRDDERFLEWADQRRLRQHHGDTIVVDSRPLHRTAECEALWTGDFRLWTGDRIEPAIRPAAHYYGVVEDAAQLDQLVALYDEAHPPGNAPPPARRVRLDSGLTPAVERGTMARGSDGGSLVRRGRVDAAVHVSRSGEPAVAGLDADLPESS
jgi:glycosyltransferase involved in cell wall biosynthesis